MLILDGFLHVLLRSNGKNLLDSTSGPKRIDSSSSSMYHEADLSVILPVHINDLSAVFA
jgi:hypothetical protein